MAAKENVRFIYNEAAVAVTIDGIDRLVIGDLHIGAEKAFIRKGIKLYNAVEQMIKKIKHITKEFGIKELIILGDVKDTVLYPEPVESAEVKNFFKELSDYTITVTAGNHDPHLNEIADCKIVDELVIGGYAFLHGHRWPSDEAMRSDYIFAGHNHVAVSLRDKNNAFYNQKAWLVSKFNKKPGLERYPDANKNIVFVVLPAFNDLIVGMPVNDLKGDNLSPLFRNKIFDYRSAKVYSLHGEMIGTPSGIKRVK